MLIIYMNKDNKKINKYLKDICGIKNFTLRDEANSITACAFRNGFLEDLHAGKHSKLLEKEDYSRITQEEMKKIMIETSAKIEQILRMKKEYPKKYEQFVKAYNILYCKGWDRNKKKYNIKKSYITKKGLSKK